MGDENKQDKTNKQKKMKNRFMAALSLVTDRKPPGGLNSSPPIRIGTQYNKAHTYKQLHGEKTSFQMNLSRICTRFSGKKNLASLIIAVKISKRITDGITMNIITRIHEQVGDRIQRKHREK